jgi:hypothetical protein
MAKDVKRIDGDKDIIKGIKKLPFALQEVCLGMERMYSCRTPPTKKEIKAYLDQTYTCKKKHIAELIDEYLVLKQMVNAAESIFAEAEAEAKRELRKSKTKAKVTKAKPKTKDKG